MQAVPFPERQARTQYRHELRTLTYVTLDDANGGIIRNLNHEGVAVQAVGALRPQLREEMLQAVARNLLGVGITRHSEAEILELATRSLVALAALLGTDAPNLFLFKHDIKYLYEA